MPTNASSTASVATGTASVAPMRSLTAFCCSRLSRVVTLYAYSWPRPRNVSCSGPTSCHGSLLAWAAGRSFFGCEHASQQRWYANDREVLMRHDFNGGKDRNPVCLHADRTAAVRAHTLE